MQNLELRTLNAADATDVYDLQEKYADPKWFTHRDIYSIFYACINDRCIGLFEQNKLIAYSIFSIACDFDKAYIPSDCRTLKVGKFSGTVVSCSHKGMGIQKYFLNSHIEYARENNISFIMCYVHPNNEFSQNNIKKIGLSSIGESFIKHKNEVRTVLLKELN